MKKYFFSFLICLAFLSGCAGNKVTVSQYTQPESSERVQKAADKFYFYQQSTPGIADRKIYTRVYKDKEKNAYVDYNSYYITINISDSLVDQLDDETLFCVLAHECAHVEYGHIGKIQAVADAVYFATQVADAIVPGYGIGLSNIILSPLFVSTYSRKEEIQADSRALDYLANMGISYNSFVELLEFLKKDAPQEAHGGGLLDTHPSLEARIENAKKLGANLSLPDDITYYSDMKKKVDFSGQKLELENKYPFDIGPYGKNKAIFLDQYLSDDQVISLFDGFEPKKIKKLNDNEFIWVYNIPKRDYCFYILMRKDHNEKLWLDKFIIDEKNKRMENLELYL